MPHSLYLYWTCVNTVLSENRWYCYVIWSLLGILLMPLVYRVGWIGMVIFVNLCYMIGFVSLKIIGAFWDNDCSSKCQVVFSGHPVFDCDDQCLWMAASSTFWTLFGAVLCLSLCFIHRRARVLLSVMVRGAPTA